MFVLSGTNHVNSIKSVNIACSKRFSDFQTHIHTPLNCRNCISSHLQIHFLFKNQNLPADRNVLM